MKIEEREYGDGVDITHTIGQTDYKAFCKDYYHKFVCYIWKNHEIRNFHREEFHTMKEAKEKTVEFLLNLKQ